jgi:transcriptional pleiotropic regulator of transition state genes
MKTTGIVRRIDDLGRVVIPKEIHRTMGLQEGDALEMFIDNETGGLVLVPYFSEAPDKIRAIAESLNTMGYTPEEWEIAEELKAIAKRLKEIRKTY